MHAVVQEKQPIQDLGSLQGLVSHTSQSVPVSARSRGLVRRLMGFLTASAGSLTLVIAASYAGSATAQELKGDPVAAKQKISMCTGCHAIPGYKASFPLVYHVPLIAGQTEQYLTNALVAYRKGDRDHPTMRSVAGSLTDQDIADLAAFYAQAN